MLFPAVLLLLVRLSPRASDRTPAERHFPVAEPAATIAVFRAPPAPAAQSRLKGAAAAPHPRTPAPTDTGTHASPPRREAPGAAPQRGGQGGSAAAARTRPARPGPAQSRRPPHRSPRRAQGGAVPALSQRPLRGSSTG